MLWVIFPLTADELTAHSTDMKAKGEWGEGGGVKSNLQAVHFPRATLGQIEFFFPLCRKLRAVLSTLQETVFATAGPHIRLLFPGSKREGDWKSYRNWRCGSDGKGRVSICDAGYCGATCQCRATRTEAGKLRVIKCQALYRQRLNPSMFMV